jgi:hypothetical protein
MAQACLKLSNEIQKVSTSPTVKITPVGSDYLIEFSITVKGVPGDGTIDPSHPKKKTHRDFDLTRELFVASHKAKLSSPTGVDDSTLRIEAVIDSKIPGTGGALTLSAKPRKKK